MSIFDRIQDRSNLKPATKADDSPLLRLYPELRDIEHVWVGMGSDGFGQEGSFNESAAFYNYHIWVQKAVNAVANNLASVPLFVYRGQDKGTDLVKGHPIAEILGNPNPQTSSADFWKAWTVNMLLGGECGLEITKGRISSAPKELWLRKPTQYNVKPGNRAYLEVLSFILQINPGDDAYSLQPDEFCQFKFYNPQQPYRGIAPISAVRMSILIDQLAQAWSRLFFKNSARPDYALISPKGMTNTERLALEADLSERYGGSNAHKPVVLEQGITDIKTFSFAPKDVEWLSQREFSRDEVGAVFGVPDEIMGYGKDTYENMASAMKMLWTLTLVPLIHLRDDRLTRFFRHINALKMNETIQTDLSNVSELQEDKSTKITTLKTLFDMGYPVNVASEYLRLGLPAIPGGDVGYLQSTLRPTDQPWQPPASLSPAAPKSIKTMKTAMEYGSDEHRAYWQKKIDRVRDFELEVQRIMKREIQRQQNQVSAKLREGKQYGRGLYKAGDSIPDPESLFNLDDEIELFKTALKKTVKDAFQTIGNEALEDLGMDIIFDIDRPEVVRAMDYILTTVSTETNNTTWLGLIDLFQTAESEGSSIPAIMDLLSAFFGDRKSDYQTERIARTTMNGASNSGEFEAWKGSGVVTGKTWIAEIDNRTRDSHVQAHGQTVGLEELFIVGGESLNHPGDPMGSPGEIINCRCVMRPELEG